MWNDEKKNIKSRSQCIEFAMHHHGYYDNNQIYFDIGLCPMTRIESEEAKNKLP